MDNKYEVVECVKTAAGYDLDTVNGLVRVETWFRIRDKHLGLILPGGFDTKEAAQACCNELNSPQP